MFGAVDYWKWGIHARVFPKHSSMGTARIKEDRETGEEGRKGTVNL